MDRDSHGRFARGNRAAVGRGRSRTRRELEVALRDAVGPEEVAELARVLLRHALAGDLAAARELLDRLLGRPLDSLRADALDDEENWADDDSAEAFL